MRRTILRLTCLGPMLLAAPSAAAEGEWRLRLSGFWMGTGDQPVVVDSEATELTTDNSAGAGVGLDVSYRLASRLGFGAALLIADHGDFRARATASGLDPDGTDTMTVRMLTLGVDYDLTSSSTDVYVGAFVALVDYDGFVIDYGGARPGSKVDVDGETGFGFLLGLDLPLDERRWLLHAHLRYVAVSMSGSGSATLTALDYDPLLIGVGVGYRF